MANPQFGIDRNSPPADRRAVLEVLRQTGEERLVQALQELAERQLREATAEEILAELKRRGKDYKLRSF